MDATAFFMNILFPAECVACGIRLPRGTLCDQCRMAIVPHRSVFCGGCGAPVPGLRSVCHPDAAFILGAAGNYADPALRALVHALKFGRLRSAAEPLANLLAHYAARLPIEFRGVVAVPVPVSRERLRERGFNQAALIAKRFARFFGIPFRDKILVRTAHRTAQSEIADRAERRTNILGCYAVKGGVIAPSEGKIILIDDVTTSGATFTEAVKTLRAAGARKIFALAAAKA